MQQKSGAMGRMEATEWDGSPTAEGPILSKERVVCAGDLARAAARVSVLTIGRQHK